jgi:hypothetical protein
MDSPSPPERGRGWGEGVFGPEEGLDAQAGYQKKICLVLSRRGRLEIKLRDRRAAVLMCVIEAQGHDDDQNADHDDPECFSISCSLRHDWRAQARDSQSRRQRGRVKQSGLLLMGAGIIVIFPRVRTH